MTTFFYAENCEYIYIYIVRLLYLLFYSTPIVVTIRSTYGTEGTEKPKHWNQYFYFASEYLD